MYIFSAVLLDLINCSTSRKFYVIMFESRHLIFIRSVGRHFECVCGRGLKYFYTSDICKNVLVPTDWGGHLKKIAIRSGDKEWCSV
jgi:hypothetical protein